MSGNLEITFLGTGTSHGIPMIGCRCAVCASADPRDRRNRTAATVRLPDGRVLLIDVPPEFRLSAIATGLDRVDAVLLTHAHADHIMGMDDLRRYNNLLCEAIPLHGNAETIETVRHCFGYAEGPYVNPDRPSLAMRVVDGPFDACGARITPVPLIHYRRRVFGYRVGGFAYCTDCSAIPEGSWELLADLDVLALDALRLTPHPAHFNLQQALEVVERLRPRRAYLTHIAHEIGHAAVAATLPPGVELAVDGLRVEARLADEAAPRRG